MSVTPRNPENSMSDAFDTYQQISSELIRSADLSAEHVVMLTAAAMVAGAVLFEGVPGVGKTTIARSLATAIGGTFGRTQGSPDVRPMDMIGSRIWLPKQETWDFQRGPIFNNVFLADELPRSSPKTQAALLEAMEEKQVTVANTTHVLPRPFVVLATQNPREIGQGVNPLTRANSDRFPISIELSMQDATDMVRVAELKERNYVTKTVTSPDKLLRAIETVDKIAVPVDVKIEAAQLVVAVRSHNLVDAGESVLGGARPLLNILQIARVVALSVRRQSVASEDIAFAAKYVLPHRVGLTYAAENDEVSARDIIRHITG